MSRFQVGGVQEPYVIAAGSEAPSARWHTGWPRRARSSSTATAGVYLWEAASEELVSGWAVFPADGNSALELLRHADPAMFEDKRSRRDVRQGRSSVRLLEP